MWVVILYRPMQWPFRSPQRSQAKKSSPSASGFKHVSHRCLHGGARARSVAATQSRQWKMPQSSHSSAATAVAVWMRAALDRS
jgi:hypothetical protein